MLRSLRPVSLSAADPRNRLLVGVPHEGAVLQAVPTQHVQKGTWYPPSPALSTIPLPVPPTALHSTLLPEQEA